VSKPQTSPKSAGFLSSSLGQDELNSTVQREMDTIQQSLERLSRMVAGKSTADKNQHKISKQTQDKLCKNLSLWNSTI
jgi:hypothetical protein